MKTFLLLLAVIAIQSINARNIYRSLKPIDIPVQVIYDDPPIVAVDHHHHKHAKTAQEVMLDAQQADKNNVQPKVEMIIMDEPMPSSDQLAIDVMPVEPYKESVEKKVAMIIVEEPMPKIYKDPVGSVEKKVEMIIVEEPMPKKNKEHIESVEKKLEILIEDPISKTNKESTLSEVFVKPDGSIIESDEKEVKKPLPQELQPPVIEVSSQKPSLETSSKKPEENQELGNDLRSSESHPAQIPLLRATAQEENSESSSEKPASESPPEKDVNQTTTAQPNRPLANIQQAFANVIETIRPANVIKVVMDRFSNRNTSASNATSGNRDGEEPAVPVPGSSNVIVNNIQNGLNNSINSFRETVNNAINSIRPTPAPGAESDEVPARPLLDSVQQNFNNGLDGFSNNINNFINSVAPQAPPAGTQSDEATPAPSFFQTVQQNVQQNLAQFGQNIFGGNNPDASAQSDEAVAAPSGPVQQVQAAISNNFNQFVGNLNQVFQQNNAGSGTQNDEPSDPNNQGPFASISNAFNNFVNQYRPGGSSTPSSTVLGDETPSTEGGFRPDQAIQSGINNIVNIFRPSENPLGAIGENPAAAFPGGNNVAQISQGISNAIATIQPPGGNFSNPIEQISQGINSISIPSSPPSS